MDIEGKRFCEIISSMERMKMSFELVLHGPREDLLKGGSEISKMERKRLLRALSDKERKEFYTYRRKVLRLLKKKWGDGADLYVSIWDGWNSGLLEDFMVSEMNVKLK